MTAPAPRCVDWPEDFPHENGDYSNRCCYCQCEFRGHKRRIVCKVCADKPAPEPRCAQPDAGIGLCAGPCPVHRPAPEPSGRMSEEEFERIGLFITDPGIPRPGSARAKYWAVMSEASRARASEDALREALEQIQDMSHGDPGIESVCAAALRGKP